MNKKSYLAFALAFAGGVYASSASAVGTGVPWTVDESAVPGALPNIFTADSFDFTYTARIEQANDGGALNGDPFQEKGYFEASAYKNGISTPPQQLNALGGYGLYGVFDLNGTAAVTGTGITATFLGGTLSLYLDPGQNTTKTLPSFDGTYDGVIAGSVGLGNTTDPDLLIGTATVLNTGEAHLFAGLANGDYEVIWGNWSLTSLGSNYWPAPSPFHTIINFNGNTTTVSPAGSATEPFSSIAEGSGNAFFNRVPEPSSLALLGIGLVSFSTARRRYG